VREPQATRGGGNLWHAAERPTIMRRSILLIALGLALLIGACGGAELGTGATSTTAAPGESTPSNPPTTTQTPGDPADVLLLEVRGTGGFAPVEVVFARGPSFVLYRDGSLWFEGPTPEIFPGPMVTPYQRIQLTPDQMEEVLASIEATGLPEETESSLSADDGIADALDIVFTYVDQAGEHRMSVYALGVSDPQDPAVIPYMELEALLQTLAFTGDPEAVVPDRYQIVVTGSHGGEDDELATVEPWPLTVPYDELPTTDLVELRCTEVGGDEAAALAPVLEAADQMTFFETDGSIYRFTVRPLAPHEEACAGS
jgi:hypothetical protein